LEREKTSCKDMPFLGGKMSKIFLAVLGIA